MSKTNLLETDIAYVRVSRVADGLAGAVSAAFQTLQASNTLKGLVLDLRFAEGEDFAAAAAVADLFIAKERPLLDWGNGAMKSTEKQNALTLPVAILINRETTGAAEALAAVLRDAGAGLLLGSPTAGAGHGDERISVVGRSVAAHCFGPVKLGDGTALSAQGVKPDIEVKVGLEEERIRLARCIRFGGQAGRPVGGDFQRARWDQHRKPPATDHRSGLGARTPRGQERG